MVKIDLITGFLGSGKTTFIRKYVKYFLDQGLSVGILENDHGAINIDMMLLSDLIGEKLDIEMISGGCDYETHKRRFKTKLIAMGMSDYDRVIVEPSGIFDTDEFFDILHEEPIDRWYEIGSVITIVEKNLKEELNENAKYLMTSQLARAGVVLVSKASGEEKEEIEELVERLNGILSSCKCKRRLSEEVFVKDWEKLTDEDFKRLSEAGFANWDYEKKFLQEASFESIYIMNGENDAKTIAEKVTEIFKDSDCGEVFRMKGFLKDEKGWLELNATREERSLKRVERGQEVIIVIGNGLQEERIREVLGGEIEEED